MMPTLRRLALPALFAMHTSAPAFAENPVVVLSTSKGDMSIELFERDAPATVKNFLSLVESGFYEGLIFHRVIPGFVIQAGGHTEDMAHREAPGTVQNESDNGLRNDRYTLAMARLADPDSAGAQFFVNMEDNDNLNHRRGQPGYTVFGRLVDGQAVADAIEQSETTARHGMTDVPATPIVITGATRQ